LLFALTGGDAAFGSSSYLIWTVISSFTGWAFMLAILGFGMERLNYHNPLLNYANEAVLPFYALHQSILFVVGFTVLAWPVSDLLKWAIILTGTFAIIMALYEYLIRRINVLRVLFGMKPVYRESMVRQPAPQVS
jgi:hypothetical protein